MKVSTLTTADALRQYLFGAWRMSREIKDRANGQINTFIGICHFEAVADGLRQIEQGTLVLGDGQKFGATRSYYWAFDGAIATVKFDDFRHFITLSPPFERLSATHDCPPDFYQVEFEIKSSDAFISVWTVNGPRKNYVMSTNYWRI